MPFGGRVMSIQPCNNGLLLYVYQPMRGPITLMWNWGNLPYLMHIVPHPQQWLIGMASYVPTPCMLAYVFMGEGFPILYHGSSI